MIRFLGRMAIGITSVFLIGFAFQPETDFWLTMLAGGIGVFGLMSAGEDSYKHRNGL